MRVVLGTILYVFGVFSIPVWLVAIIFDDFGGMNILAIIPISIFISAGFIVMGSLLRKNGEKAGNSERQKYWYKIFAGLVFLAIAAGTLMQGGNPLGPIVTCLILGVPLLYSGIKDHLEFVN